MDTKTSWDSKKCTHELVYDNSQFDLHVLTLLLDSRTTLTHLVVRE